MTDRNFKITWDGNNAIVSFFGIMGFEDLMQANNLIVDDERYYNQDYQIFDFSNIDSTDIGNDVAKVFAALDNSASVWNNKVRVATVTKDKALAKTITEYNNGMKSTGWEAKTFRYFKDALNWCKEK